MASGDNRTPQGPANGHKYSLINPEEFIKLDAAGRDRKMAEVMDHIRGVWEQTLRDREKRAADIRAEKEKMENPEYLRRDYEKWSAEVEAAMEKMKVRPDERRTIRTAAHHDEIDSSSSAVNSTNPTLSDTVEKHIQGKPFKPQDILFDDKELQEVLDKHEHKKRKPTAMHL